MVTNSIQATSFTVLLLFQMLIFGSKHAGTCKVAGKLFVNVIVHPTVKA